MIHYVSAGESHGPAQIAIISGIPAGLKLTADRVNQELQRRRQGYGRGKRMRLELDQAVIISGVRNSYTLGSPIALQIINRDYTNWGKYMDSESANMETVRVSVPRPGHADLAGVLKYKHDDIRNVSERASARETVARTAAGAVAKIFLQDFGVDIFSHVLQIGSVKAALEDKKPITPESLGTDCHCADPAAEVLMKQAIVQARNQGDTLGGVFEIIASGAPVGLGSYVEWHRRLDARLAAAVMSIPGIKGVEIGEGFATAGLSGNAVHDEVYYRSGRYEHGSNHAGGIEGGMTNGENVIVRAAMKPIPTLRRPLRSVDIFTHEPSIPGPERADVCAVPAAGVIGESMVALVLADAWLEKFGGDSMREIKARWEAEVEHAEF